MTDRTMRGRGRPAGSVGEIAQVLLHQARQPGTVRELAARAQVGFTAAAYTCSRLRSMGQLVPVCDARPARLVAAATVPALELALHRWAEFDAQAQVSSPHDDDFTSL